MIALACPTSAAGASPSAAQKWVPPSYGGTQPVGAVPTRVDVYTDPSILPGEPLELRISSPSPGYRISITRETYAGESGPLVAFSSDQVDGVDQTGAVTWDASTATARANWATSLSVDTTGWEPGVYSIATSDGDPLHDGSGLFVIRTPSIGASPLFAMSLLTYQAYNTWGGASYYSTPRSVRLSFDRPYSNLRNESHGWAAEVDWVRWLSRRVVGLQYTTDYDLSAQIPVGQPSALLFGQHAEYIGATMRNWVDRVSGDRGGMELANFGANAFYWQTRLERGPSADSPLEMVTYKYRGQDPLAATNPELETLKWRDMGRPEGKIFGSRYATSLLARPITATVTGSMPRTLLRGTGWRTGTRLVGLFGREADSPFSGVRAASILQGQLSSSRPLLATVVRTGRRGAKIFNAGSMAWVIGFREGASFGVSRASFERFNENILRWLGIPLR